MNNLKTLVASILLVVPLISFAQASGGQITRKKQNTSIRKSNAKPTKKQYAPNEVITDDGGKVIAFETTKSVDLGLPSGTIWAGWNIGASSPKEIGGYYAWGEIFPKNEYTWQNYFDTDKIINENGGPIEYKEYHVNGKTSIIGTNRDVAFVNWGYPWKMPSKDQIEELISKCSVYVVKFPNDSERFVLFQGPNGKCILFPKAGHRYKNEETRTWGELCWSGELRPYYSASTQNSQFAFGLEYNYPAGIRLVSEEFRLYGLNVRAVK